MKVRLLVGPCAAGAALAALPAAASACPSLRGLTGFKGHAHVNFDATASGDDGNVELGVAVKTTFSGNVPESLQPDGQAVSGASFSHREAIPASLKLDGVVAPDGYDTCSDAFTTGHACYTFDGGWSGSFEQLALCHSISASTCTSSNGFAYGAATFAWHLSPAFKKKRRNERLGVCA